jgi:tRNA-guanine family transglycosylase
LRRISTVEGPGNSRILNVEVGKKRLATPTYFPAISRKEIRDHDDKFLELVTASGYPRLLVSAYDYGRIRTRSERKAVARLHNFYESGSVLILDSGVFESYWRQDHRWTFRKYRESAMNIQSDFFLSFDVLPPEKKTDTIFRQVTINYVRNSRNVPTESHCIPIVHGASPTQLLRTASDVTREFPSQFAGLAVSERELGNTISQRCATIMTLRRMLNRQDGGILHILGCGQPLSIALYVYSGADTFDSLDWAVSAFDPIEERTVDFAHFELLKCNCLVCNDRNIHPSSRVYLHNLLFCQMFFKKIHMMIKNRTLNDYLQVLTNKEFLANLAPSLKPSYS